MRLIAILFSFFILISFKIYCQNDPVIVEAENGILGSDYQTLTDGDVTYITPKTNYIEPTTRPNNEDKVATFSVTFPDSGTYKLFARIRIGPANYGDDSFYHGNGFGTKDPTVDNDWIICNSLVKAGYTYLSDVVQDTGDAGLEIWKWLALSDHTGYGTPITFRVEQGELIKTFEIGAREDGFDVDKIAFGREGIYYTVDNLNKGEAGSKTDPGDAPPVSPLADGLDKFFGCGFGSDSKRDFANYWNQVTPGNAGKWGSVEGTCNNMVWTELDEAYQLAMDNNFIYKHHVMVWGSQQPDWIETLDSAQQRAELEEWFDSVASRYPGIDQVEVVNEPLHQPPTSEFEGNYIAALGDSGTTGWDWIIEAFRMARAAFADTTVLMINEYNIINNISNTDEYLKIINLLQDEDTLINAIGFQAHGFSQNVGNDTILRNIDTLASTGLPLYVTELDIDGLTDLQQVHGYMNLFPLLWEHEAIKGITLWGFRPEMWRGSQGAYIIDELGVERPAMLWLRAYLKDKFIANQSVVISTSTGVSTIGTNGGTLQMLAEFTPDTSTLTTAHWTVSDTNIATIDENGLLTALTNGTVTVTAISLELDSDVSDQMDITITGQFSTIENLDGEENIKIYPNPSNGGQFSIDGVSNMTSMAIIDINGRQIFTSDLHNQSSVDINLDLIEGLYFILLSDGTNSYHTKISVR